MSILPKLLLPSLRSSLMLRALVPIAVLAIVLSASSATATPVILNVPGTIVLVQSFRHTPDDRQCGAHVFGQWADVAGTQIYSTVKYKENGDDATKSAYPLYNNAGRTETASVAGYIAVPPGFNRILLGTSGGSGGSTNREEYQAACDALSATLLSAFTGPVTVDVAIEQPTPTPTPTPAPTLSPSEQLLSSVNSALNYAKAIKVAVPRKDLAAQKAVRKSLSTAGSAIVKFVKANESTIKLKPTSVKLSKLADNVKKAITLALKLESSTFVKDKSAVVKALNAVKKVIAS